MKNLAPSRRGTGLAVAATLALVCGCNANHVLGTDPKDAGSPGSAGSAGMFATGSAGSLGVGNAGTTGDDTGSAGASGAADATGVGTGSAGTTGAAGTSAVVTGSAGTLGTAGMAGPLGPPQSWTGYIEQYLFPSGSDAIKLTFATDAQGIAKGTVVFGQGQPPPPATDPNIGYPPDFETRFASTASLAGKFIGYLSEGYSYSFDGGSLAARRLRFTVDLDQLWAQWCTLQAPASDSSSHCFPGATGMESESPVVCSQTNPLTKVVVDVDCGVFQLCVAISPCACTVSSCGLSNSGLNLAVFDVFMSTDQEGDILSGSVASSFANENVHFTKDN